MRPKARLVGLRDQWEAVDRQLKGFIRGKFNANRLACGIPRNIMLNHGGKVCTEGSVVASLSAYGVVMSRTGYTSPTPVTRALAGNGCRIANRAKDAARFPPALAPVRAIREASTWMDGGRMSASFPLEV